MTRRTLYNATEHQAFTSLPEMSFGLAKVIVYDAVMLRLFDENQHQGKSFRVLCKKRLTSYRALDTAMDLRASTPLKGSLDDPSHE